MRQSPKTLICYLGMGNSLVVLSEHSHAVDAHKQLEERDFNNASLQDAAFYVIEAVKVARE